MPARAAFPVAPPARPRPPGARPARASMPQPHANAANLSAPPYCCVPSPCAPPPCAPLALLGRLDQLNRLALLLLLNQRLRFDRLFFGSTGCPD